MHLFTESTMIVCIEFTSFLQAAQMRNVTTLADEGSHDLLPFPMPMDYFHQSYQIKHFLCNYHISDAGYYYLFFAVSFSAATTRGRLLSEDGVYFVGKPADSNES